jgi:hypothetical protein
MILSAVCFVVILASRMRRGAALLAFLIAFVLGLISLLPTPSFVQYFCMGMPFLIVAAVCATSDYVTLLHAAPPKSIAVLSVAMVLSFTALSVPGFRRYLVTGDRVIGVNNIYDAPNWTLDKVNAVSKAINQLAAPNEEVASFWPGYIFASKADPYPGLENDFGGEIANKLTVDQRAKYHIIARSDIEADLAAQAPRIVVLGNQAMHGLPAIAEYARILRTNDYTAARTVGDTSIFVCCSARQ